MNSVESCSDQKSRSWSSFSKLGMSLKRFMASMLSLRQLKFSPHFVDVQRSAFIAILQAGFNGLPHVDFAHQVVPGCVLGQVFDQALRLLFYIDSCLWYYSYAMEMKLKS